MLEKLWFCCSSVARNHKNSVNKIYIWRSRWWWDFFAVFVYVFLIQLFSPWNTELIACWSGESNDAPVQQIRAASERGAARAECVRDRCDLKHTHSLRDTNTLILRPDRVIITDGLNQSSSLAYIKICMRVLMCVCVCERQTIHVSEANHGCGLKRREEKYLPLTQTRTEMKSRPHHQFFTWVHYNMND